MRFRIFFYFVLSCSFFQATAQNAIDINATIQPNVKTISISQTISYTNTTTDTLSVIYLSDWNHSYSSIETPLAKRFAEEFKTSFQFSNDDEKGFTSIESISQNNSRLNYTRLANQHDIIQVVLNQPVLPNSSYTIQLDYELTVPSDKFTRYGITNETNLNLQYWYFTPVVYNGNWQFYSNKNLSDLYAPKADISIMLRYPTNYVVTSELNTISETVEATTNRIKLQGNNRVKPRILIKKNSKFTSLQTQGLNLVSNIDFEDLDTLKKDSVERKVIRFITDNLGSYPHEKLLLTETEYKQDPIYGLNLLPKFIRPFPDTFQYELKILKTALKSYLQNTLLLNPRDSYWLLEGIQTYYLMEYVNTFYPNMKAVGKLADVIGIRWFHAADLEFNDQYVLLYMHMVRSNLDQAITTPKDSLIKFNETIANKYKTAIGFNYLSAYDDSINIKTAISNFLKANTLNQNVTTNQFKTRLKKQAFKNIDWYLQTYLNTNETLDYKIKRTKKKGDSIIVTLKNKRQNNLPVTLDFIRNDSVVASRWISDTTAFQTYTLPRLNADKIKLNASKVAPEINLRNNHKNLKGLFNKPLQLRLIKDIEDPDYNQIFFMPDVAYNFYDGLILGTKFYNKTVLSKDLVYKIIPAYGLKSNQLNGSASVSFINRQHDKSLFYTRYGFSGKFNNYAPDLSFYKISPFVQFRFRDPNNLRKNFFKHLTLSFNSIYREEDPTGEFNDGSEPNYNIFSATYGQSNRSLTRIFSWYSNIQTAEDFGKLIFSTNYRKITSANREYNVRFYAGAFLYNNTPRTSNYFSFALDRPTDYLFEYNYLGRSETTGVLSQQLIIAEGGFKSKLKPAFANQWISTVNANTTIWKYIYAYGDIGLVKNKGVSPKFVYDSGIRLSLVADYFELYFPIYSNNGWEIGQPNYDQKIRFIITLSPQTLLGLFTRRWY